MTKHKQLIILAQSLEQPRIVKRIIEKSFEYEKIQVYGFNREIHSVNNYGILKDYSNINVNIVGTFYNNKYLNRFKGYIRLISIIYKNHGKHKKHLYVFGLDLRIISSLFINSKIDYEISDIMWLYKPKIQKHLLKKIDGFLVTRSNKVTFTSRGFYNVYYKKYKNEDSIIIKENKFKTYGKVNPIVNFKSDGLRVAYIGAFRYNSIIQNLIESVSKRKDIILNFYGDGSSSIIEFVKKNSHCHKNINFHGAFKNPDDLEKIYSENNLNFVVYDNSLENEKVAMPNKYYESGYFNIPIVAAKNTYVGKRVLEQNMGWTIGIGKNDIASFLDEITMEEIVNCHENIKGLDKTLFEC